jgi:nitrate/nitrite-specific signal transduction histidine kinase
LQAAPLDQDGALVVGVAELVLREDLQVDGHMGLVSMSERAQSIGAALEVESAPGKGTKVKLRARPGSVSTPEG